MFKNKFRFTLKLFIIVWIVLFIHVVLKLSFNYWQPYVIPTEQLQSISDFIDSHKWIKDTLDGILYMINGILVYLCSLKIWWFKNKKTSFLAIVVLLLTYLSSVFLGQSSIVTLIVAFGFPLLIDKSKWLFVILTFLLSNLFMILSLILEGFVNTNDMQYICKVFLQFDYYIMLVLNYFAFNLIKKKE